MSDNGGYNYGNNYSYGYEYSSQSQNFNANYDYATNHINSNGAPYPSTFTQPALNQQNSQQSYDPAASLLNNPAAQIGIQFGTQALSAGQDYVNNNVPDFLDVYIFIF